MLALLATVEADFAATLAALALSLAALVSLVVSDVNVATRPCAESAALEASSAADLACKASLCARLAAALALSASELARLPASFA